MKLSGFAVFKLGFYFAAGCGAFQAFVLAAIYMIG